MTSPTPDMVASIDQMGATLGSIAEAIASYRRGLLDSGMPTEAAEKIVFDCAQRMHVMMFPTANPLAGLFGGGQ